MPIWLFSAMKEKNMTHKHPNESKDCNCYQPHPISDVLVQGIYFKCTYCPMDIGEAPSDMETYADTYDMEKTNLEEDGNYVLSFTCKKHENITTHIAINGDGFIGVMNSTLTKAIKI